MSAAFLSGALTATALNMDINPNTNTSLAPVEKLELIQDWDKVFPKTPSHKNL